MDLFLDSHFSNKCLDLYTIIGSGSQGGNETIINFEIIDIIVALFDLREKNGFNI